MLICVACCAVLCCVMCSGHGVGAALNVHEGPQSISTRYWITTPLEVRGTFGERVVAWAENGAREGGRD